jgi:hypothetical protein
MVGGGRIDFISQENLVANDYFFFQFDNTLKQLSARHIPSCVMIASLVSCFSHSNGPGEGLCSSENLIRESRKIKKKGGINLERQVNNKEFGCYDTANGTRSRERKKTMTVKI